MNIVKKLLKKKHKEYKKQKIYMLSGDIEYYTFTYSIPIYKTPPIPEYHKCFCWHKDEIIVDLDKENKKLKNIIKEVREYIEEAQEKDEDKESCSLYVPKLLEILKGDEK